MQTTMERSVTKNLGVLIFGRKRPGFDQDWSQVVRERCLKLLGELGYKCIGAEKRVLDDETIHAALDEIEQARCCALVIIQPSMSDAQFALTVSQRWSGPLILWVTPERPGDGKVSSCSLVGGHMWGSLCAQMRQPFELVYGGPVESEEANFDNVKQDLDSAIHLASTVSRLRSAKMGVVGTHVPGFLNMGADPSLIRRAFGTQLLELSLPQFIDRVRQMDEGAVRKDVAEVRKLGLRGTEKASDEHLAVNSRYYLAIRELMQEMSLDALAIQCWPELPNTFEQWPYLSVVRLTSAGCPIAIEGDVDGALLGLAGRLLGMGTGFQSDWIEHDEHSIFFWHPGMAPLDMCKPLGDPDGPALGQHFNGGRRFVVDATLLVDRPVTVSRIWRCDGRYHVTSFEGKAVPAKRRVSGNSLLVEVGGDSIPERFDRLVHAGMPHHVTLHYGSHSDILHRLTRLIGIDWHR